MLRVFALVAVAFMWTAADGAEFRPDVRPGPGVTDQKRISDYFPPLKGSPLDTEVYILDSGKPGATGLMIGGTHGNELAGQVAALLVIENVTVSAGRLVVIPYANRSAISVPDTRNGVPAELNIVSRSGPRVLPYGDRRTDPADQGVEDPEHYTNPPGYTLEIGAESRNLNRTWPGDPEGTPTEQLSHSIMRLIREEGVDFSLDMHEADTPERQELEAADYSPTGNKRLAYTLVAHPRGLELAAYALLEMEADTGITMKLEESNSRYRGLSHLEIADNSPSLSFLSESPNPGQDRWRSDGDVVNDPKYPLTHRAGLHLRLFRHLADAFALMHDRALVMEGMPEYDELMSGDIGRFLN
ncbi:MAG: succinylglutamate desuccinylase/aspartoacylase family protein [Xanthomonadales bacterium]|jgi:hypothetical protein|nr:succinylglutamate desuccinylase/aspartoacylase family protein [Xanthomonadales bacterium]